MKTVNLSEHCEQLRYKFGTRINHSVSSSHGYARLRAKAPVQLKRANQCPTADAVDTIRVCLAPQQAPTRPPKVATGNGIHGTLCGHPTA